VLERQAGGDQPFERQPAPAVEAEDEREVAFRPGRTVDRAQHASLERLISHRLPLEHVGRAFELLREGTALRTVLDLTPARSVAAA